MSRSHRVGELLRDLAGLVFVLGLLLLQAPAQSPSGSTQPTAASSGNPTLTQTTNPDGSLVSTWTNPDGTVFCKSIFRDYGNGHTTRVATIYQNGGVYYTNTYTTNSDGTSTSEFVYFATNEKL